MQLDEQIEKSKTAYEFCKNELKSENPTIFDITKERIIRAAAKIANDKNLDLGFKIYELTPSIKASESNLLQQFLSDEHKSALLETFRLQNGVEFSVPNEKVILQGAKNYECVRVDDRLFLLNGGFKSEHLRALLEKIDTDEDFVIKEVIYLNNAFESARIRELEEGLKSYSNKKGLKIDTNARCL